MIFETFLEDLYDKKKEEEKYIDAQNAATTFAYVANWMQNILQIKVHGAVLKRRQEIKRKKEVNDFGDVQITSDKDVEIDYPLGIIRVLEPAQMVDKILNDKFLHLYHPCIIECSDTTRGLKKTSQGLLSKKSLSYNATMYNGGWHRTNEQHWTSYEEALNSFVSQEKINYICCDKSSLVDRIVLEARDMPQMSSGRMRIILGKEITPKPKRYVFRWANNAVSLLPRKIDIGKLAILG